MNDHDLIYFQGHKGHITLLKKALPALYLLDQWSDFDQMAQTHIGY